MTDEAETIVLRRATVDDAAPLSRFAARCFEAAFGAETDPGDMKAYLDKSFSPTIQAQEIADVSATVLLAFAENQTEQLIGYAYYTDHDDTIELHRLYVDVSWHGRGLAGRLMRRITDSCVELGAKRIQLTVWTKNHRAIAFYERLGFKVYGSETFMVGDDAQTDHAMELVVSS
jgi:diamine N-acetyltransferase